MLFKQQTTVKQCKFGSNFFKLSFKRLTHHIVRMLIYSMWGKENKTVITVLILTLLLKYLTF
jgi:hypothetical protein